MVRGCRVVTFWPSDTVKTYVGLGLMFIQTLLPIMILVICYGKIIWVLTRRINTDLMKNKSSISKSGSKSEPPIDAKISTHIKVTGKDKFQLARRNTIKTLLIVGLCFIICWSQNEVMYFMYNCEYDIDFSTTYFQFTILMIFLNCTVNPFIYLIKYKDYQKALRTFFHCNKKHESDSSSNLSISSTL